MNTLLLIIGNNIKKYRQQADLSQESLADISDLHRTYIGSVERGERNISVLNLEKIARSLGVPIASLFTTEDEYGLL